MLRRLFGWFGADVAVDLGTANTLVRVVGQGLVLNEPQEVPHPEYILSNSFGMLGINSAVVIKKV